MWNRRLRQIFKFKRHCRKRKYMTILEFANALVTAVAADVAAGNTSFTVTAKPDNSAIVLTSSVSNPSTKTEEFPVVDPNASV